MDREYKSLEFTNIKAQSSGRVRAGIAAVFGNVDSARDRILPGAFAKTLGEGAKRARFLWNHSYQHPPVASIKELREITRGELPAEVLAKAPEATGGLLVKREYYDVELANWILAGIDAGDINEMSFAYEVVKSSTVTEPVDDENSREVQELHELKLFDISDVLWGCNSATVASGAKNFDIGSLPLGVLASQLAMLEAQLKAGRRNSASDQKLVDMIHSSVVSLGAVCAPADDESDETGKSKAEAAKSTSLSPDWFQFADIELANLEI